MRGQAHIRAGLVATIALLAVTLVVLLVNLAPMMANARPHRQPAAEVRRGVTSAVSLLDATERAEKRIAAWAQDAVLVRAEASWYLSGGWERIDRPPVAWAFYYYSASESCLASVVIDDDVLLWVPPLEIPIVPRSLTIYPPDYGIDVTWQTFRAAGAEAFLKAHPEAQVSFRLQQVGERPAWLVSAFDAGEFFRVTIDAQSGIVIPEEPSPDS